MLLLLITGRKRIILYNCQSFSNQDVLEKLRPLHPLPGVILEWRRITNALTKVVFPLQREKQFHPTLKMNRIYPVAQTHTATGEIPTHYDVQLVSNTVFVEVNIKRAATLLILSSGRVSFTEPNVQNVPKDFEIHMPTVVGESPPSQDRRRMTKAG